MSKAHRVVDATNGTCTLATHPIGTAVRIVRFPAVRSVAGGVPSAIRGLPGSGIRGATSPNRGQPGIAQQHDPDQGTPARLPRGRHHLPREAVKANQRQRLLAAGAVAVAEHGYANHTITHLTVGAGVSRRTFYEHFTGKQDVLLAAYDAIFGRLLAGIERACAAESEWSARLAGAVSAALHFAVAEPEASRLLTVDAIAACPQGAERVLGSKDRLAAMLLPGRHVSRRAAQLPALTEWGLIAALWSAVGAELLRGCPERLIELQPQLTEMTLAVYREDSLAAAC